MAASRCPYCDRSLANQRALRLHIGANGCGQVPAGVAVEFSRAEGTTEAPFQEQVIELARRTGWTLTAHVHPCKSTRGRWLTPVAPGFPDVWLVRDGRMVVLECKSRTGKPRPGQGEWIATLDTVPGVAAAVVGPDDWPVVQALLTTPH